MTTYTFDNPVEVKEGEIVYVVTTSPEGDCLSVFRNPERFEAQVKRGIWEGCRIYRLTDKESEVIQQ